MAGNWKMNLDHMQAISVVQKLAWALTDAQHDYSKVEVAVIPPFTDIRSVQTLVEADSLKVVYGAQDVSVHDAGAFTGEVSAEMLAKLGCTYVVVGHSERRQYHAETDELIGQKAQVVFGHGMTPIICVGENLDVRKAGQAVPHTLGQVDGCLKGLSAEQAQATVIAYEPIWAIGTGEVATPADAQEVCGAIRQEVGKLYDASVAEKVRVLYGGSVKSKNVAAIMAEPDVDGALVGGASLDPSEFCKIVRYQDHVAA
jgi:triosephosphate isomerase